MKKALKISLITFIVLLIAQVASAEMNNYFLFRYEHGWNDALNQHFSEKYIILENNSLNKWALGTRLVGGENNFKLIIPHIFFKITPEFHIGARYSSDSIGNEFFGPALRYKGIIWEKFFTILDVTQYFDSNQKHDKTDAWLSVSLVKKEGWYCGFEIWYFNIRNGTENLKFRPLKVGYKLSNGLAPFLMIQRHWNNAGLKTDALLGGVEILF